MDSVAERVRLDDLLIDADKLLSVRALDAVNLVLCIKLRDNTLVPTLAPQEVGHLLLGVTKMVKHRRDVRDSLLLLQLNRAARRAGRDIRPHQRFVDTADCCKVRRRLALSLDDRRRWLLHIAFHNLALCDCTWADLREVAWHIAVALEVAFLLWRHRVSFHPAAAVAGSVEDVQRLDAPLINLALWVLEVTHEPGWQVILAEVVARNWHKRELAVLIRALHIFEQDAVAECRDTYLCNHDCALALDKSTQNHLRRHIRLRHRRAIRQDVERLALLDFVPALDEPDFLQLLFVPERVLLPPVL